MLSFREVHTPIDMEIVSLSLAHVVVACRYISRRVPAIRCLFRCGFEIRVDMAVEELIHIEMCQV